MSNEEKKINYFNLVAQGSLLVAAALAVPMFVDLNFKEAFANNSLDLQKDGLDSNRRSSPEAIDLFKKEMLWNLNELSAEQQEKISMALDRTKSKSSKISAQGHSDLAYYSQKYFSLNLKDPIVFTLRKKALELDGNNSHIKGDFGYELLIRGENEEGLQLIREAAEEGDKPSITLLKQRGEFSEPEGNNDFFYDYSYDCKGWVKSSFPEILSDTYQASVATKYSVVECKGELLNNGAALPVPITLKTMGDLRAGFQEFAVGEQIPSGVLNVSFESKGGEKPAVSFVKQMEPK